MSIDSQCLLHTRIFWTKHVEQKICFTLVALLWVTYQQFKVLSRPKLKADTAFSIHSISLKWYQLPSMKSLFSCFYYWMNTSHVLFYGHKTIKLKPAKVLCQIKHTLSTFMQKKVFHVSYEYEEYILTVLWDRNDNLWKG